ncbi:MBL fold metallo-hydrolase [Corticicoccus populi]|uniref:MBL fold metallo-hydrolase n=1 Tax=Corticicoccus populi TaxID=1812821 RepID=A0ABW5WSB0_9STAP
MNISKYKNIYQLTFARYLFPINCFVIERENDLVVIDMGLKNFNKEIVKLQRSTGKNVSMLLLTHAHSDHVNGTNTFRKYFKNAEIGISKRESYLLNGDMRLLKDESQNKIRGGFSRGIIHTDFTFEEGDVFDSIQVINTPGHTPGSVSFYLPANRSIIVGDAFQTKGRPAVSGDLNITFPFPALATWDKKTALNSAYKIKELHASSLFCGHGHFIIHPEKEINQAIKHLEKKLL